MYKNVIIYGAGRFGKEYIEKCIEYKINGIRIIDGNSNSWETEYRGIRIQKPDDVLYEKPELVVLAVSEKYRGEIEEQLLNKYNIPKEKIVSYTETVFLRDNEIYNFGGKVVRDRRISGGIYTKNDILSIISTDTFNDLEKFFFEEKHNTLTKWLHYFDAYDRFFSKYRDTDVTILEIGVFKGGSLQMWKRYFDTNNHKVKIYGIDINPDCKELEEDNIEIMIGSQEDRDFLRRVKEHIGKVDILIDDGGHTMNQQITTFEELFDMVSEDGIYLCEDLHTSYMKEFGGEYKGNTFIEYSKNLIDYLHAQYSETDKLVSNKYAEQIKAITYYDSMIFIEKKRCTTKSVSIMLP